MELLPRITRAQSMDVLSSQANLAGYRAVIEGAAAFERGFPMMMTAAGTVPPARVFVIGAGVAGLQAIATARRLGAIVSATDVRPAAKEEIKSLGASFVGVEDEETAGQTGAYAREMSDAFRQKQAELMATTVAKNDLVICTALVQGRKAPVIVTQPMVDSMKPGSVVVDLAAEAGGNCAATVPGEAITTPNGVRVLGYRNWPGRIAVAASNLYARNLLTFLTTFWDKDAKRPVLPETDDIVRGVMLTRGGQVVHHAVPARSRSVTGGHMDPNLYADQAARIAERASALADQLRAAGATALAPLEPAAQVVEPFVFLFAVFLMACFVGYYVVWNVTPALHSPLMAVTNAISSVIVVGAILAVGLGDSAWAAVLRLHRGAAGQREHLRRVHGDAANAVDVPGQQEAGAQGMSASVTSFFYLVAAVLFILALRGLSSPVTSRQGNMFGMIGMVIAVLATLLHQGMGGGGLLLIALAIIVGGGVGVVVARRIQMTALPQLVAAFHSLVGLAAVFVAAAALNAPGGVRHRRARRDPHAVADRDVARAWRSARSPSPGR